MSNIVDLKPELVLKTLERLEGERMRELATQEPEVFMAMAAIAEAVNRYVEGATMGPSWQKARLLAMPRALRLVAETLERDVAAVEPTP